METEKGMFVILIPAIAVIIFELGEDAEPGTYVGEINAVDKDGFPVEVSIDSPEELFVLENTSIILNGELDYETAIEHEIQVFAVSERGSSNTFVTIPVSDIPNTTYTQETLPLRYLMYKMSN